MSTSLLLRKLFIVIVIAIVFAFIFVYDSSSDRRISANDFVANKIISPTAQNNNNVNNSSSCFSLPPVNKRISLLYTHSKKQHPIEFSKSFRNPCWYEKFDRSDIESLRHNPYLSGNKPQRSIRRQLLLLADAYEAQLHRQHNDTSSSVFLRLRCLPSFHIIGQVKCGTTDLFRRLARHPRVHMGLMKEPNWWTRARFGFYNKVTARSYVPLKSYVDLYEYAAIALEKERFVNCMAIENGSMVSPECRHSLIGDASVATFSDDIFLDLHQNDNNRSVANYMKWLLPGAKILVLVREPVARLFSDYLFFHRTGFVSQEDFHDRVVQSLEFFEKCKNQYGVYLCARQTSLRKQMKVHLHLGLYAVHLRQWLGVFPKEKLLIVRMEDYASETRRTMMEIFQFLELCDPSEVVWNLILDHRILNFGTRKIGPMWNRTRILLQDFYADYNAELAQLLNDNKYLWKDYIY